jgi:murein DD-endopeptidase MepM/ murein hydrolase activator NlpD
MARRLLLLLVLALALVVAGVATADNIGKKKHRVDAKLSQVQQQLLASKQRAIALTHQVGALTSSIQRIELQVGGVSQRLSTLDQDIALHRDRLQKLNELLRLQTRRYRVLRRQYRYAVQRLDERLVHIYEEPQPSTIDVLLAARSFQAVLDEVSYLGAIAQNDKQIAARVQSSKRQAAAARHHTASVKQTVATETQVIRGRAQQVSILRAQLLTSQGHLSDLRGSRRQQLLATQKAIQQEVGESNSLASASAALAAKLKAQESGGSGTTTTGGSGGGHQGAPHFIWPVQGPITSPFGMRWGVLHPGIDIGVPTGTPVHAAAAGQVVWCGWMSGYGNFVVIDHGGGYATAYGHNSKILVTCGEDVHQGQVVSLSGCTGFCTGPHVHFEVRVNGTPVDPLGYLG